MWKSGEGNADLEQKSQDPVADDISESLFPTLLFRSRTVLPCFLVDGMVCSLSLSNTKTTLESSEHSSLSHQSPSQGASSITQSWVLLCRKLCCGFLCRLFICKFIWLHLALMCPPSHSLFILFPASVLCSCPHKIVTLFSVKGSWTIFLLLSPSHCMRNLFLLPSKYKAFL